VSAASEADRHRRRLVWVLAAAFVVLALGLYANGLSAPFHYDDQHGIVDNPLLRDPANLPRFFDPVAGRHAFSPTEPDAIHYRPLLLASYTLNFVLGGESPVGFHLYNVLLHALAALVLVGLALRLGLEPPWATGLGLLFLASPFHTEAVDYVSARSSLQSGLFSLAALLCFVRARQGAGRARYGWLAGALALMGAALLTKEVAVTVPLMFLLYDLLHPPARADRWGVHGFGLHALLLGAGLAYLIAGGQAAYFLKVLTGEAGARGFGANLWLQAQVLVRFAQLILLPAGLSIVHDFAGAARPSPAAFGCAGLLLAVTAWAVAWRRRTPLLALGWGLFLLVLLPTTLLPMNTPLQESRGYAAAAGLMLAAAAVVRHWTRGPRAGARVAAAAGVVLVLFAAGTVGRNPVWGSDRTLWADAVRKAPGDFRAHANLGAAYHAGGDLEAAVREYRAAIALFPGEAAVHADLGGALIDLGRPDEAAQALERAISISDRYAPAHFKYAILLQRTGRPEQARAEYERAVELVPTYVEALMNLGILLARGGDLEAGIARMEQALAARPRDPALYLNLMVAYRQAGTPGRAAALYREAEAHGAVTPRLTALWRGFGAAPPRGP